MSPGWVRLGDWTCRSGNNVEVYLEPADGAGSRQVQLRWDSPPPLSAADQLDYDLRILPALARRAQEYLERGGGILVVRL